MNLNIGGGGGGGGGGGSQKMNIFGVSRFCAFLGVTTKLDFFFFFFFFFWGGGWGGVITAGYCCKNVGSRISV